MSGAAPLFAAMALAPALGYALAWLRPDLDLQPRLGALWSTAAAAPAAITLAVLGGGVAAAVFFAALAVLSVADLRARLLPDVLTLPLIAFGLLLAVPEGIWPAWDRVIGAALGYGSLRLFEAASHRFLGREGMGRGDAKLFAAIGAFLGWAALPEVALVAALAGLAYGLVVSPKGGEIPFGPMLSLGALAYWAIGPVMG